MDKKFDCTHLCEGSNNRVVYEFLKERRKEIVGDDGDDNDDV